MKTVVMRNIGDVDVLEYVDRRDPTPWPGEVLVGVAAAGVNFMDIVVRQGVAWTGVSNPKPLGVEGAGRVLAVGEGVSDFAVGDRVAWAYAPGSYAEQITMPAESLVPLPDDIDFRTAASVMMNGLTASHFATEFYPVQEGDIALVHSAAGGVGSLLTQIIKLRGGRVIGRVSSEAKRRVAMEAGVDNLLVDSGGTFVSAVMRLTNGEGVHVVYGGAGPASFKASLRALRRAGTYCWPGPLLEPSRAIELFSLPNSIKIGFAVFADHIRTPALLRQRSASLFDWVRQGKLKAFSGGEYALSDAAHAHADLGSRKTSGKLILIP
ncbi:quinone oxidoreductase family protein [Cupriavidus pauculus]|uniref:Alcohol dehydrogenase n=1 Tax=Cupriavidus pauculus TaxID=82633 RepID=A0A2N5C8A6_9BURK|nr:quinone oxidoreductase [Cupriavidus pauculus]PLP98445.1 alcohol dehydrogenase [Cupriavidus pauculus]